MITHVEDRERLRLDGRWRSIVDPYQTGYLDIYGRPWPVGWFKNLPLRPGISEIDWDRADLLDVPGDWNSQDDRLFFYEGNVWYRRDFHLSPASGERVFLHFGAANHETIVWLNGEELGRHEGGFTPFEFEISDRLAEDGENFVVVKVDNTRRREAIPTTSTDWWNYGGITRSVDVVRVPETFVHEYSVQLSAQGTIEGWVQLDGPAAADAELRVTLPELEVVARARTAEDGRAVFAIDTEPERWSPDTPRLYDVEIAGPHDSVRDRIGFRTIEVRGTEVLLNGEPIFLRGISIHEEAPNRPGRAFGEDDARTLLGWARDLGCNFVRLAHYPHDAATSRVADEMGLLVWAELPVYWNIAWEEPATLANAKQQLGELIGRDRNRACVVLWSLSNESPANDARVAFLRELVTHARELDGTRLLTAALMARMQDGQMCIDDPIGEQLDVMGCNEYLGWYYGELDQVAKVRWTSAFEKPLIMSELGAGALQGVEGDEHTLFSEVHQARVYEEQIAMMEQIPFLAGVSPWILKDFRSPRRPLKDVQDYYNRKGLVSERGIRKRAFGVLQRWYRDLAERR